MPSSAYASAHRNDKVAAAPRPVRTACRLFHFTNSAREALPADVRSVAIRTRFVGIMPSKVHGQVRQHQDGAEKESQDAAQPPRCGSQDEALWRSVGGS